MRRRRTGAGGDPYWITTRRFDKCHKCQTAIPKGSRAFYYPNGQRTLCEGCGKQGAAEFSAAAFDEDNNRCL